MEAHHRQPMRHAVANHKATVARSSLVTARFLELASFPHLAPMIQIWLASPQAPRLAECSSIEGLLHPGLLGQPQQALIVRRAEIVRPRTTWHVQRNTLGQHLVVAIGIGALLIRVPRVAHGSHSDAGGYVKV
jgi:hypothetical protein